MNPNSYTAKGCDVLNIPGGGLFCECATVEQALKVAMTLNQFAALIASRGGPCNSSLPAEPTKEMMVAAGEAYFSGKDRAIWQAVNAALQVLRRCDATGDTVK